MINATTLLTALAGANVTVSTSGSGSGDLGTEAGGITVATPLSWSAPNTLTLDAYHSIAINAGIGITGGGGLTLTTNNGGSGGTLTFGSGGTLTFGNGASASFAAGQSGQSLTINGNAYTLLRSMADIDAIDTTGLSGRYALAGDQVVAGTYTDALVGVSFANPFTGVFEGLGHTITGLTVTKSGNYAGLFGFVGAAGVVRDIGLVGGAVSGSSGVGGLVGNNRGTISNAYATGTVSGTGNFGGFVGANTGTITNGYWDTRTSGQSTAVGSGSAIGVTGRTTAQLQTTTAAANLGSAFGGGTGLYPYLTSLFPGGVQAVSGTAPTGGTVHLRADTGTVATASVGTNGYYYVALPAGSIAGGGSSLLTWSIGAATNGATFRTCRRLSRRHHRHRPERRPVAVLRRVRRDGRRRRLRLHAWSRHAHRVERLFHRPVEHRPVHGDSPGASRSRRTRGAGATATPTRR